MSASDLASKTLSRAAKGLAAIVAGVFELAPAPSEVAETFKFRAARAFALLVIGVPPLRIARAHVVEAGEGVDGIAVHLVGSDIHGRTGFRAVAARHGDLAFYDLAEPIDLHFDRATSDAPELMLWFPRARLPKSLAEFDGLHGLTFRSETPAGRIIGAALKALSAEGETATDREFDAMAEGVLALIAAAIAPALETQRAGPPPLASFLAIRRYVDKNIQAPGLNGDSLAKTFGLSRASLYRLFEPVGGVASYIRAARLRRAYREIVDAEFADRRIGPIAYGLGFKNISAFNRLFREEFGASPRKLRAGRASSELKLSASAPKEGEFTLLHWLRQAGAVPRPARGS